MKTIIEMAREAGFFVKDNEAYSPSVQYDHELTLYLERFADLVRADECEACAKACEKTLRNLGTEYYAGIASHAIRARGNT